MFNYPTHNKFPEIFEDKLLWIHNESERDKVARIISNKNTLLLEKSPIPGIYDLRHLSDMHCYIFKEISSFAGSIRNYTMWKNNDGFLPCGEFDSYYKKKFPTILKNASNEANDRLKIARHMNFAFNALNTSHPFREGNGRAIRVFVEMFSREHGFTLNLHKISNKYGDKWNDICANASRLGVKKSDHTRLFFDIY